MHYVLVGNDCRIVRLYKLLVATSLEASTLPQNSVMENPKGSAVGEIFQYKQTDRQTDILLLFYKDAYLLQET